MAQASASPMSQEQHQNIHSCFAGDTGILTEAEACMSLTLSHMNAVAHQWVQAVDYVEWPWWQAAESDLAYIPTPKMNL